jgi:hypothetical protein
MGIASSRGPPPRGDTAPLPRRHRGTRRVR